MFTAANRSAGPSISSGCARARIFWYPYPVHRRRTHRHRERTRHAQHAARGDAAAHAVAGVGPRGYSPKGADSPTLAITLHPAPVVTPENPTCRKLITSSFRLPAGDRLATFKTANKLAQVLARTEAEDRGADEALLLNTDGHFAEVARSNLFWIEHGGVCTTPLTDGMY